LSEAPGESSIRRVALVFALPLAAAVCMAGVFRPMDDSAGTALAALVGAALAVALSRRLSPRRGGRHDMEKGGRGIAFAKQETGLPGGRISEATVTHEAARDRSGDAPLRWRTSNAKDSKGREIACLRGELSHARRVADGLEGRLRAAAEAHAAVAAERDELLAALARRTAERNAFVAAVGHERRAEITCRVARLTAGYATGAPDAPGD
jgi:hypothetical protein